MGLCLIIFFYHESNIHRRALLTSGLEPLWRIFNWSSVDLKSIAYQVVLLWVPTKCLKLCRLQAPSRRFQSKQLKSALPLKLVKSWSVSPALCTLWLVRKLWIAPEWVFPFTKQRHSNWLSWEGYCKNKRKCVWNCFDSLGEIKETLESRAKVYTSYSFKKILGV